MDYFYSIHLYSGASQKSKVLLFDREVLDVECERNDFDISWNLSKASACRKGALCEIFKNLFVKN